jgi:hypothetical protein
LLTTGILFIAGYGALMAAASLPTTPIMHTAQASTQRWPNAAGMVKMPDSGDQQAALQSSGDQLQQPQGKLLTSGNVAFSEYSMGIVADIPLLPVDRPSLPTDASLLPFDASLLSSDRLWLAELTRLRTALQPDALIGASAIEIAARTRSWEAAMHRHGLALMDQLADILPPAVWFQARLITAADTRELARDAQSVGAYGEAYRQIQSWMSLVGETTPGVNAMLNSIWAAATDSKTGVPAIQSGHAPVLLKHERWFPPRSTLAHAHQYALDIFFTTISRSGAAETGPPVRSISRGIVVATASDWDGGDREATYRQGGLSPKAGNGAIIWCPDDGRYYAYFHLKETLVQTGAIIAAGTILGPGGNTGTNARKKGHGAHVHIEIHESDGTAWTSYRIRDFILSIP